jgi:hypothetical protein
MSEVERMLVLIGRELDVPEAPELVPGILGRIEPRRAPRFGVTRRPLAVALALVVVAALVATLAVPPARSALLRFLHLGGERIEFVDELPEVTPETELELTLGQGVTLAEARRRSGFELSELDEPPDRVYLGIRGTVWFLYGSPERVRLLLAQTPLVRVDEELILKKLAGPGTTVEVVSVDGVPGYFVSGEAHLVLLLDEFGQVVDESARLARDVLVWERDGVAFRLEGDLTKDEAVELAESLR